MSKFQHSTITRSNTLYLLGGLCAGTSGGRLFIAPDVDGGVVHFQVTDQKLYVGAFRAFGLDLVGWEEVGEDDSIWHTFPLGQPWHSASDYWNALAYGAHVEGGTTQAETARSIGFSLLTASLRMRDICREYTTQNIYATKNKVAHSRRFSNVRIFELYMALHSFLAESSSARDYIARFIANHFFDWPNITTMAALNQKLIAEKIDSPVAKLVTDACDQSSPNGWLARLSKYRNLIMHQAPINRVAKESMLRANTITIQTKTFYQVTLSIPKDPLDPNDTGDVDALVQFRDLMLKFFDFSRAVGAASGITARVRQITDADLK